MFTYRRSVPRQFCSQQCKYASRVKREEHSCPTCGATVVSTGRHKLTYCSSECSNAAKVRMVAVTCRQCGETFTRSPSRMSPYCSAECYDAFTHRPFEQRFWDRVVKSDGCWTWTGAHSPAGYGMVETFTEGARHMLTTHRVSYEMAYGQIPDGLYVCHRCDNRGCLRPDHLFVGTQAENLADMVAKDRHSRGERSGDAVLTDDMVLQIRASTHERDNALAERFGVSPSTIWMVRHRKTWKHLP